MALDKFTPGMLRDAKVPHYDDINGQDIDDLNIRIKLFDRDSGWSWYIAGGDQKTGTCFGWIHRGPPGGSLEYFQLSELNKMNGHHGVLIARSTSWNPRTSLGDVIEEKIK